MKKSFLLIASSVLLFSCNDATENTATTTDEVEHVHYTEDESQMIELDNGEKWTVNEEMKPHVLKGEEVVKEYLLLEKDDHKALAADLKEFNNALIQSCTMDGKSHDELHKWLHPHLELVTALDETDKNDKERANVIIAQLDKSYEEYHNYFL